MTQPPQLDPELVAQRLRRGAALFRFLDAAAARARMEGRGPNDGHRSPRETDESFPAAVARRLEVLRALDRRRRALRRAFAATTGHAADA